MKKILLPLTKQILYITGDILLGTINKLIELSPARINRYLYNDRASLALSEQTRENWKIRRAIRELERRKYIEIKKKGEKMFLCLTSRGFTESMLIKIKDQSAMLPKDQFCIICFDIPEAVKDVRQALRRFLKVSGFKQLQKSVWYTDRDVFEIAKSYIKNLKAGEWIKIISASIIE